VQKHPQESISLGRRKVRTVSMEKRINENNSKWMRIETDSEAKLKSL
jgi:hypothetical protein